jgi:hypothetical protein
VSLAIVACLENANLCPLSPGLLAFVLEVVA